jgi:hypothetical protein
LRTAWLAAFFTLALALSAGQVRAATMLQVKVSGFNPLVTKVAECDDCRLTLRYIVVNSGTPVIGTVTLGRITEYLFAVPFTDTTYDVASKGYTNQYLRSGCGDKIRAGDYCDLDAIFRIDDADPTDSLDPTDDFGLWAVGVSVPWSVTDDKGVVTKGVAVSPLAFIDVYDAPAPEPASWALLILGLGATGAALRRSRPLERASRQPFDGRVRID